MTMAHSNLDCFLNCTTPIVPSQSLSKRCIWDLKTEGQPLAKDAIDFFNLGDLWDWYGESSAYGVGAPILNHGHAVVQYYTPYLSAIQIYTTKDFSKRCMMEDCNAEFGTKLSGENNRGKISTSCSGSSDKLDDTEDLAIGVEHCELLKDQHEKLYFEYFEVDGPFCRAPLKDKIDALCQNYPGLKSFNSVDLSPASWMAVAWYPIYLIPAGRNAKELYASFLTYHALSSSIQGNISFSVGNNACNSEVGRTNIKSPVESNSISLPSFGLATYKMQANAWLNPDTSDHERISTLLSAADLWLKQRQVQHHDFNFFTSHPV